MAGKIVYGGVAVVLDDPKKGTWKRLRIAKTDVIDSDGLPTNEDDFTEITKRAIAEKQDEDLDGFVFEHLANDPPVTN